MSPERRQSWRGTGRPCPDLSEETDIVPAGPVLDDDAVDNPPDVNVGPRDRSTRGLGTREQSHGRGSVAAVDRHVVDDEVAFSDEMVVIDGNLFTEIVNDRREDLFPTLSALRTSQIVFTTCGVVHQVFGDKFIDDGVITCHYSTKQLFDDILRFPAVHPLILP
jgi:hypothetical protein